MPVKSIIKTIKSLDDAIYYKYGKIRVLFVIRNSIGYYCLLQLIEQIILDNSFDIRITIEEKGCFDFPEDSKNQNLKNKYYIDTSKALLKKWHYVFLTDMTNLWFRRHTTLIATHHGVAFGNLCRKIESDEQLDYSATSFSENNISLVFPNSISEYNRIKSLKNKAFHDGSRQFLVTGFIKSDYLIKSKKNTKKITLIKIKHNIDCEKKIITIFSHWTEYSLLRNLKSSDINKLITSFKDYHFIILGHPLLWRNHDNSDRKSHLFSQLTSLGSEHSNLSFFPTANGYENSDILSISDCVIGDNSSFFVETCIMDKPIIFFDHHDFKFLDKSTEYLFKDSSTSFSSLSELEEILPPVLQHPSHKKEQRKKVVEYFTYQSGNVSNYIIKSLKQMGRVSGPKSKHWKIVVDYCNNSSKKPTLT